MKYLAQSLAHLQMFTEGNLLHLPDNHPSYLPDSFPISKNTSEYPPPCQALKKIPQASISHLKFYLSSFSLFPSKCSLLLKTLTLSHLPMSRSRSFFKSCTHNHTVTTYVPRLSVSSSMQTAPCPVPDLGSSLSPQKAPSSSTLFLILPSLAPASHEPLPF